MQKGICRICKESKLLSFEHIPPRVAFNKDTKYYSIPQVELLTSKDILEYKPKGKLNQGGIGDYCLCQECNSFLGRTYVPEFSIFANIAMDVVTKYDVNFIHLTAYNQFPLKILKQIVSMFVCINEIWYTKSYPELLNFIKDPNENYLPENFRISIFLNNEGQIRKWPFVMTSHHGKISELVFPPFGYILQLENQSPILKTTDITFFKNYKIDEVKDIEFTFFKNPTHLPLPIDFRNLDEIKKNI